jgi:hypothetical protein
MYALVIFTFSCIHGKWAGTLRIVRVGGVPVNVHYKVRIYKESTVYVPSSELGLSQPLSRQRVCPSPQNRGWGKHTRLRVRGWGSPNSDDLRKS